MIFCVCLFPQVVQKHQLGEVANETSVGYQNMLGIFCAKNFENRTILTKVTVKNVGATFLTHGVNAGFL